MLDFDSEQRGSRHNQFMTAHQGEYACAMTERDVFDITIIGAGPTGLFAAFYAGMRQARTQVIDSLAEPGGALTAIYPEKYIYDVPGFPKVLAKDFVEQMVLQAERDKPTMRMGEEVTNLEIARRMASFRLTTSNGDRFSKTVIICAGVGAFEPKRLDAPGVADLEGKRGPLLRQARRRFSRPRRRHRRRRRFGGGLGRDPRASREPCHPDSSLEVPRS